MLPFLILFGLSFMTVCFICFTFFYVIINVQKQQPHPFQKAAEQTVDTVLLVPLSWLFTALYICGLFILLPARYLLNIFQQKR